MVTLLLVMIPFWTINLLGKIHLLNLFRLVVTVKRLASDVLQTRSPHGYRLPQSLRLLVRRMRNIVIHAYLTRISVRV